MLCRLRKLTTLAFIVFEWLERTEPNSTTLNDPRIKSKSVHPLASAAVFPGWQRRNFACPFQVSDDAMQMEWTFTKPFNHSTPLVCWLNLISQYFVSNVFNTSAIRNAYSFHQLSNIHFFEHFLQLSHNLRTINGQNNIMGGKNKKIRVITPHRL